MSPVTQLISEHYRRQPGALAVDAMYGVQMKIIRDLLERLDEILDDMGTPEDARRHITRCMLYGYPSRADAELRGEETERYLALVQRMAAPTLLTPRSTL